jgi:hypothetical protein
VEAKFKLGTKVILHSTGAGRIWPPEKQKVIRVARNGHVFVSGAESVPFKQNGEEALPGAFRFRFRIELPPTRKTKPKKKSPRAKKK